MHQVKARNDDIREKNLDTLSENFETDPELAASLVMPETEQLLAVLRSEFSESRAACRSAKAIREGLVAVREEKRIELDKVVRYMWIGLVNRTDLKKHSLEVLTLYGGEGGKRPPLRTCRNLLMTAETLLKGEEMALARGYAPLTNPDMGDLRSALAGFSELVIGKERVDLILAKAQTELRQKRGQVDKLLKRIYIMASMAMDDKPASYRRRILRNLGYGFASKTTDAEETIQVSSGLSRQEPSEQAAPQNPTPIRLMDERTTAPLRDRATASSRRRRTGSSKRAGLTRRLRSAPVVQARGIGTGSSLEIPMAPGIAPVYNPSKGFGPASVMWSPPSNRPFHPV